MKSINEIFKSDINLLDNECVIELIVYCHELEDEIIEKSQLKTFSKEDNLAEMVRDIYHSVNDTIKLDEDSKRFHEITPIDYEVSIKNLKKYIETFSKDNHFRL